MPSGTKTWTETDATYAAAFSAGADARLAGLPLHANPHPRTDERAYKGWRRGWQDCSWHFAEAVNGRWQAMQLPRLGRQAEVA